MKNAFPKPPRLARNLILLGGVAVAITWPRRTSADEVSVTKQTFTYKISANSTNQLQADVHRAADVTVKPVVIFIHGGALMMGGRGASTKPGSLFDALLQAGYAVVSIDYRLAPQVKRPAIIEDLQDACRWVREKGPELFHINPKELIVMGQSAGGYLTQVAGYRVTPRPKALVSF